MADKREQSKRQGVPESSGPAASMDDEFLGEAGEAPGATPMSPAPLADSSAGPDKKVPRKFSPPPGWVSPFEEGDVDPPGPKAILGPQPKSKTATSSQIIPDDTPRGEHPLRQQAALAAAKEAISEPPSAKGQVTRKTAGVGVPLPLTARHHLGPPAAARHATNRVYPADAGVSAYVQAVSGVAPAHQVVPLKASPAKLWMSASAGLAVGLVLGVVALVSTPAGKFLGVLGPAQMEAHTRSVLDEERRQVKAMLSEFHPAVKYDQDMEDFRAETGSKPPEKMTPGELSE